MKAANADDIRRMALSRGAQAVIGGRTFNADKTVSVLPAIKPAAISAVPAVPAKPELTMEMVDQLVEQRMTILGHQLQQAMTAQCNAMTLAVASALKDAKPEPGKVAVEHRVTVKYDNFDRITDMTITPFFKKA